MRLYSPFFVRKRGGLCIRDKLYEQFMGMIIVSCARSPGESTSFLAFTARCIFCPVITRNFHAARVGIYLARFFRLIARSFQADLPGEAVGVRVSFSFFFEKRVETGKRCKKWPTQ